MKLLINDNINAENWGSNEVVAWLTQHGLTSEAVIVKKHNIDGKTLVSYTEDDFRRFGIDNRRSKLLVNKIARYFDRGKDGIMLNMKFYSYGHKTPKYRNLEQSMNELRDQGFRFNKRRSTDTIKCLTMSGLEGTPYSGGEFVLWVFLSEHWPFSPAKFKFETKIWHPDVNPDTGEMCDAYLWEYSPAIRITTYLLDLRSRLDLQGHPDLKTQELVDNGFESTKQYTNDPEAFYVKAAEWTQMYAKNTQ